MKKFLILLAAAVLIAAVGLYAGFRGAFLPHWISWQTTDLSTSISCTDMGYPPSSDSDVLIDGAKATGTTHSDAAENALQFTLTKKHLTIRQEDEILWTSDPHLLVQDFLICDINHDGSDELLLLCWRIGRFGDARPFWVTHDENTWSQHIYIYEFQENIPHPVWMASDIGMDVSKWSFDPVQRLVITEANTRMTQWDWVSWGLSFIGEYEPSTLSILISGDQLIHESMIRDGEFSHGGDYTYLYEDIAEHIQNADLAILNQETMYVEQKTDYSGFPLFGTPLGVGKAAIQAGFDIAACANNHALDKGMDGIRTTLSFYDEYTIPCIGIQDPSETSYRPYTIVEKNGIRIALLNYTYGTNGIPLPSEAPFILHTLDDETRVREDIRAAHEDSDLVILLVHWGTEYEKEPDDYQKHWAEVFLEEGVDVVAGNHPHVLQDWSYMEGSDGHRMLIYYSLGNLVSAQESGMAQMGGLATFTIVKTPLGCSPMNADLYPIRTYMKATEMPIE